LTCSEGGDRSWGTRPDATTVSLGGPQCCAR
jgi:hypothetical protein